MKKFIAVLLASTTIFTCSKSAFAEQKNIDITQAMVIKESKKNRIEMPNNLTLDKRQNLVVNGKKIDIKEGAIVYQDRLFLPVRELGDTLDVDIDYVSEQKIVALDNGNILLPVGENKAVVNGEIVAIDKNNDKVGTLIVNDKTYLPVSFVASSLKTQVSDLFYKPETKTTSINTFDYKDGYTEKREVVQKLNKDEAIKVYSDIIKVSNEIKNLTSCSKANINFTMSDGETSANIIMSTEGVVYSDIKDKVNMYSEQKNTVSFMGEKETVEQKMFYQDGKVYIKQTANGQELKYKMDLNLEDFIKMSSGINLDDELTKNIVLDGEVENIDNNQKKYTFTLDMSKSLDLVTYFTKDLGLTNEDLQILESLKMDNVKYIIIVNEKNEPISQSITFNMTLKSEDTTINMEVDMVNTYENIGTTVVKIPNEDLSKYENFKDMILHTKK